jgi:hypothetical protein
MPTLFRPRKEIKTTINILDMLSESYDGYVYNGWRYGSDGRAGSFIFDRCMSDSKFLLTVLNVLGNELAEDRHSERALKTLKYFKRIYNEGYDGGSYKEMFQRSLNACFTQFNISEEDVADMLSKEDFSDFIRMITDEAEESQQSSLRKT